MNEGSGDGATERADDPERPWQRVLRYWFGDEDPEASRSFWFQRSDEIDAEIRQLFAGDLARARAGEIDAWADTPRGRLALVIVLDQFSRNLHRDSGEAYISDSRAQELVLEGIERGDDRALSLRERWFLYMPLMHAEDLGLQDRSVALFEQLVAEAPAEQRETYRGTLKYARHHHDLIARFGRFPHRNQVLGRTATEAENQHLARGERF